MSAEKFISREELRADVLLTHSFHLAYDAKQWRKMQPYPPLGTLYAATALREAGISVAVFDPTFVDPCEGFSEALKQYQPKLVVLYEDDFNFVTKMCLTHMRDLGCTLAQLAQSCGCTVIAHGSDASDHPDVFLGRGVDYILNGEAEQSLAELCTSLLATGYPKAVQGLVPSPDSELSALSRKNSTWKSLPEPARDLIDLEPYRNAWISTHGFFSLNVVASRGCPYRCNWCAKPISGSHFQLRAPDAIARELHLLSKVWGVDHIWFSDDIFGLDRHWVEAFADAVEAFGTPIPFKIQSRADLLTASTVAALKRSGCTEIWMGVESGSQKILNAMTKGLSLPAVHAARRHLAEAGIRACFFLQLGYPGEGWPEILETIALVRHTKPDDIGVSISYPLPGTLFYERVRKQLGDKRNWLDSDDLCAMHTAAYTDVFYQAVRTALHAEVEAFGKSIAPPSLRPLWAQVESLERSNRNPRPLTLPVSAESFLALEELTPAPWSA